jgi:DNA-binding NarL/FixJ family response regulator
MKTLTESTTPVVVQTLRILVADDHSLVRQGLRTLLEARPGWTVCGEAVTGIEAIEKARQLKPDIIVLDIHMPETDGLQAARSILADNPHSEILILTVDESEEAVRSASEVGAHGIVMKSGAADDLIVAVAALARHETFHAPRNFGRVVQSPLRPLGPDPSKPSTPPMELTTRERDIVVWIANGHSHKQIAAALNISPKTVESHRRNIMRKLGLKSAARLVRYAIHHGLVEP